MFGLDAFAQTVITCTGCTSLYLLASQSPRVRMWGAIVGLIGEPFWLTTAWINEQAGIVLLAFVYGVNWTRIAFYNWKEVTR